MDPTVTKTTRTFQRAFLAMRYLLGVRGDELLEPLRAAGSAASGSFELVQRLNQADREARAASLAAELLRVARALDRWSLG